MALRRTHGRGWAVLLHIQKLGRTPSLGKCCCACTGPSIPVGYG